MSSPVQLLIVADAQRQALLIVEAVRAALGPVDFGRVETREQLLEEIKSRPWSAIIADHSSARFSALGALQLLRELRLDVPLVIVSASTDEELAVAAMRAGASDVISAGNLIRLAPALERELREAAGRRARRLAEHELRVCDRRFRAILDSTRDVFFTLDRQQRHTGAWGRWFVEEGLDPSRLLGRTARELIGAELARVHEDANQRALGEGVEVLYESSEPGGCGLRHFRTSLTPARNEQGEVIGLIGLRQEITDQKNRQAQLLVTDRLVSVGLLAAGMAHEINNPLTAVVAGVEYAREQALGDGRTEQSELVVSLDEVRHATESIRRIVRDVKLFSRPGEEEAGPADVHRALEAALRMAKHEIRHRAQLVKDYGQLPPVAGSEARLGQVFLNLILNAAQAIGEGDVTRNELRISTSVDCLGQVVVEVRDTGAGILPEHLGRLFDPFFTTKPVDQGTGLGLFVCHKIVTELGGQLSVHSEPGKGSEFRVRLPPAQAQSRAMAKPPVSTTWARRGRVLVVDDEESIGTAMRRILAGEHEVVVHNCATTALDCLREGARFDVILCDLMMPRMTGMEFHSNLIQVAPDQAGQVVFFTGGAFTSSARRYLEGVPNEQLEKPVDSLRLRALINDRIR